MDKIALFVDGASMFYAQRDQHWHIDFRSVHQLFTYNKQVFGAFYFTATPPASDREAVEKYRKFRGALINMGYSVIDKEVKVITDRVSGQSKLKGNLDIELVFRMLSAVNSYDEAVLLGGDSDYLPIINHLRNLGKNVVCVGRKENMAIELRNACNRFIDLEEIRNNIERRR